jgi:hypothetical protein
MDCLENCNIEKLLRQDKTTETIRLGNQFLILDEHISKRVNSYFIRNYKKLSYKEFIKSNDYYIQRIQLLIENLETLHDTGSTGLILQEQIIRLEIPIYNARRNESLLMTLIE